LAGLLLAFAAQTAHAQEGPGGKKLTEDEINHLLYGATLYGKYTDGRPDWSEQSAVTGQLYDGGNDWEEVGRWGLLGDMACYQYYNTGLQHCFEVYEFNEQFFFYSPGTDHLIAYTTRIDREQIM
jgi:hypothetical protein